MPLVREIAKSAHGHFKASVVKAAAAVIEDLERRQGRARPHDVVEAARPRSSPLHGAFEWRDDEAAERWRICQARRLINAVQVVYLDGTDEKWSGPGFVSVTHVSTDAEGKAVRDRGYVAVEKALADPVTREQLLTEALAQADYWKQKWRNLSELAPVFQAVEKVRRRRVSAGRREPASSEA